MVKERKDEGRRGKEEDGGFGKVTRDEGKHSRASTFLSNDDEKERVKLVRIKFSDRTNKKKKKKETSQNVKSTIVSSNHHLVPNCPSSVNVTSFLTVSDQM